MNFPAEALRFLRALERNNRREWFNAHRDDFEAYVRQPMTAIVERLAVDFGGFAQELVASPKVSIYRIYRDTRFSDNKLTRVPRGFSKEHPAAEYLKLKHFVAGAEFPATLATSPAFYKTLLTVFRQVVPLTRFLNAPLLQGLK